MKFDCCSTFAIVLINSANIYLPLTVCQVILDTKGSQTRLLPLQNSFIVYQFMKFTRNSCRVWLYRYYKSENTCRVTDSLPRWIEMVNRKVILMWLKLSTVRREWKRGDERQWWKPRRVKEKCVCWKSGNLKASLLWPVPSYRTWPRGHTRLSSLKGRQVYQVIPPEVLSALHFSLCWINEQYFYRKLGIVLFLLEAQHTYYF